MGKDPKERFREIEREIRQSREFSLAAALGEAGGGLLAGGSPLSPSQEAGALVEVFLREHLRDGPGVLCRVLARRVADDPSLLERHLDAPLGALAETLDRLLGSDERLYDLVHRVDAEYGRMMGERPLFQAPGAAEDPEDEYTHQSVRAALQDLRALLGGG